MAKDQIGSLTPEELLTHLPLVIGFGVAFVAGLGIDLWLLARIPALRATLSARAAEMRRTPWSWREALRLGLLALLLNQAAFLVIRVVEYLSGSDAASVSMAMLFQTAWIPLCFVVLVRSMLRRRGATWTSAFGLAPRRAPRELARAFFLLLALLPPLVLAGAIAQFVLTRFKIPLDRQFVLDLLIDPEQPVWLRTYLCLAAVTVAPVVEELAFRGIVLPALARRGRWVLAAGACALLFAAAHFNAASLLPLLVLALGLSLAYLASGSLWLPIFMHALFNAFSLAALLLLLPSPDCGAPPPAAARAPAARAAITLNLEGLREDGLRGGPGSLRAVSYEFCIPNTPACIAEVRSVDSTVAILPGGRGRIGCGPDECLCIGSTHQSRFRDVLDSLAALPYVRRIDECFFE
jgi:membrane protease YdiL (CAAX protease family)